MSRQICRFVVLLVFCSCPAGLADETPAQRGYRLLTEKPYLSVSFHQDVMDQIWSIWPQPLRRQAKDATPDERRRMTLVRYGLTLRPGQENGKPLQYVVDDSRDWTLNCFGCHGGKVAGRVVAGLPNAHFDLQTLSEDVRWLKLRSAKTLSPLQAGSLFMPLSTSRGTTNAVMFGVVLMAFRDADLNLQTNRPIPPLVHHDMDAPPWWHFRKRSRLYIDNFAEKGHRALMPFLMTRDNGPEKFRQWEDDFRNIFTYLESLEPPDFPFAIDPVLATQGRELFGGICADCHGTYGRIETYPERVIPIDEIGTDRVRLDALSREHRETYAQSWFAHYGRQQIVLEPAGYVAPPLDGIWASAPYFHNGSVPTLWHVMHPAERPRVWRRVSDGYDPQRLGLKVETFDELPKDVSSAQQRRQHFDTQAFGKSAAGHLFPDELDEREKRAVLEYLKTL